MKYKNGQVILTKAEIARLQMFDNAEDMHSVCKTMNCTNIKNFECDDCPIRAIDEALCLVSNLARHEVRRQNRLKEREQVNADGQIKMKV